MVGRILSNLSHASPLSVQEAGRMAQSTSDSDSDSEPDYSYNLGAWDFDRPTGRGVYWDGRGRGRGRHTITCRICKCDMGYENESHGGSFEISCGIYGPHIGPTATYTNFNKSCACKTPTPTPRMTFSQFVDTYVANEKKEWRLQEISRHFYEEQFKQKVETEDYYDEELGIFFRTREKRIEKPKPPPPTEITPPATPLWAVCPNYHVVRRNVEFCLRCGEKNPKYKMDSDPLVSKWKSNAANLNPGMESLNLDGKMTSEDTDV